MLKLSGSELKLRNLNAPDFTQVIGPIAFGFLFADYNNRDRVCKFTQKNGRSGKQSARFYFLTCNGYIRQLPPVVLRRFPSPLR